MPGQPYALYPKESDLEVSRQRFLLWNPSEIFCFGSFSVHHATPFSTMEVSFSVFELFQKYSASKDCFGPWGWILFLLLLLQAIVIIMGIAIIIIMGIAIVIIMGIAIIIIMGITIVIIMGIALINVKAKSVLVFVIILFSWGIEGDSWLMTWLTLSCNSQSYDDLRSALSQAPWGGPCQFVNNLSEHCMFEEQKTLPLEYSSDHDGTVVCSNDNLDFMDGRRGYGGVAILWKRMLSDFVEKLDVGCDRIVGIQLFLPNRDPQFIFSVYLPSSSHSDNEYM